MNEKESLKLKEDKRKKKKQEKKENKKKKKQKNMIVCIAEKPSVAKDIARIIGATSARDGYMEGNGYQVTWTFGHLCTRKEPNDYTENWKRW